MSNFDYDEDYPDSEYSGVLDFTKNNKKNMSEQKSEVIFGKGFIFKRPHDNAPDFVKGSMSVKVSEAIEFLKQYQDNDWVNLDLLASKDNTKLYFKLNTFKPKTETPPAQPESVLPSYPNEQQGVPPLDDESIPF